MGVNSNKQLETQLLAEWLTVSGYGDKSKTHVNVGAAMLQYNGEPLPPAKQRAFGVWNDWADARIALPGLVILVEAKIVNIGSAYGQLLDYMDEYPASDDYKAFAPARIKGLILCAFERTRTALLFTKYGIDTVLYTPTWAQGTLETKIFRGAIAT